VIDSDKGNGRDRPEGYFSPDPWGWLKEHTDARIGLGRSGVSLPLKEQLKFNLDHARAKDAVALAFDHSRILEDLEKLSIPALHLQSRAADKNEYLTRPDLGRRLAPESLELLKERVKKDPELFRDRDVLVVVCDGLSALAAHSSAVKVASGFLDLARLGGLKCAPVAVVSLGRVAVADEVNDHVKAKLVVNLIGERPGLSSPDSLGAYVTYGAYRGIMEESRNCVSNIRPAGLKTEEAVRKLAYLAQKAFALKLTGTRLKDDMPENYLPFEEGLSFLPAK
jgi:ethanolamine ammonia-lyase small subunit